MPPAVKRVVFALGALALIVGPIQAAEGVAGSVGWQLWSMPKVMLAVPDPSALNRISWRTWHALRSRASSGIACHVSLRAAEAGGTPVRWTRSLPCRRGPTRRRR